MRFFLYSLVVLSFSGCMNVQPEQDTTKCKDKPWILNPNLNGNIGAVGSAMRTYDQKTSTQRKLAITRALDELSLQQGVNVDLSMKKRDIVANGNSSTSMDTKSQYSANSKVTAHIEEACVNNSSGEFFVWMVMD